MVEWQDSYSPIELVLPHVQYDSLLMDPVLSIALVLVLVLNKDTVTIKRMLTLGIRVPGLHSYVRGYNLTQENACCLRLQPHLYPSMVETGLGRGDELRHSRRE